MSNTDPILPNFAPALVKTEKRADGTLILSSPRPLAAPDRAIGVWLRHWEKTDPDHPFIAERAPGGGWRKLSYGEAARGARAIGQALLDRGLGPERPLMILSGASVDHALMALGAMEVGVPVVPVSVAYSLMSQDQAKVAFIADLVKPGMVFVQAMPPFAKALTRVAGAEVVTAAPAPEGQGATPLAALLATRPGAAAEKAFAALGPDTVAKILFTSGSTGMPKGVINTQRMLTANMEQLRGCWTFLVEGHRPVLLDWLPWNHTFGGNHDFNLVLRNGGTLYIDAGRPAPGLIEETVRNLREVSPTLYLNVPAGYGMLLPYLEKDDALASRFFKDLLLVFYAGAALPQDMWERMEKVAIRAIGRKPCFVSSWGSTETAPMATAVHFRIDRAGVIGIPAPGVAIKMAPSGAKMELRVKGPNVTPGYFRRPDLTRDAFDEDGFYRIGDAGRLVDPGDPAKGLQFDGRVAEDFKLVTGTWVATGALRIAALAAASPLVQDAVITGHDRAFVGLLAWPNVANCRAVADDLAPDAAVEQVINHAKVREHIRAGLARMNAAQGGSSVSIARVLLMAEPPQSDANEITDKGYVNQRATLERRAALVERLHADPPPPEVVLV